MEKTYSKRGRVARRSTPSTILKKSQLQKKKEAFHKLSPEKQAELMQKIALQRQFLPQRHTMWSVPPPLSVPPPQPVQPYGPSPVAKRIGEIAAMTTRMATSSFSPMISAPAAHLAQMGAQSAASYFGYGFNQPTLLATNHPAHYRVPVENPRGTPMRPIYHSLQMQNAF